MTSLSASHCAGGDVLVSELSLEEVMCHGGGRIGCRKLQIEYSELFPSCVVMRDDMFTRSTCVGLRVIE